MRPCRTPSTTTATVRALLQLASALTAGLTLALLAAYPADAATAQQSYPSRPLRIVSPFAPGAFNDLASRTIAAGLQQELGQTVVVDNRPGAGSVVGAELVARSTPDGYTLLMASNPIMAILPSLRSDLPFDPVKDLTPVSCVAAAPKILITRTGLPASTVRELIALAKSQPGKLNFASAGIGTLGHLSGELFNYMAGVNLTHVPYKGTAAAQNDLMGGRIDLQFSDTVSAGGLLKSDRLRVMAVMTMQRLPELPEVPTFRESGLEGLESYLWNGVVVRSGTPKEIVERLSRAIAASLKRPGIAAPLSSQGAQPIGDTPGQFAQTIAAERVLWARMAKATGIRLDR